jgi:hypothetical protein
MFTYQNIIDQSAKYAKDSLLFISDKKIREDISSLIDTHTSLASDICVATVKYSTAISECFFSPEVVKSWTRGFSV